MKPIFAQFTNKDILVNSQGQYFYYLNFLVKFDSDEIKELRIYTNKEFNEPIQSEISITDKLYDLQQINLWQKELFYTSIQDNETTAKNNLYCFEELNNECFSCKRKESSLDELDSIFSKEQGRNYSICSLL